MDSACYPSDLGSTKSEGTCPSDSALAFGDEPSRPRECRRRTPAAGKALELGPGHSRPVEDADGNGFSSPLYRADGSQRRVYVPIPAGNTCADIADATAVCGTRHLFVTPEHTEDWMLSLPNTGAYEQEVLWQGALGPYVDTRAQTPRSTVGLGSDAGGDGVVCEAAARTLPPGDPATGPHGTGRTADDGLLPDALDHPGLRWAVPFVGGVGLADPMAVVAFACRLRSGEQGGCALA